MLVRSSAGHRPKPPNDAVRLLLDENVSPAIGAALTDAGHDVRCAASECPGARDPEVIALAIAQERTLVTEDKDFGELVVVDGLKPPGLIRIALPNFGVGVKAQRLIEVLAADEQDVIGLSWSSRPLGRAGGRWRDPFDHGRGGIWASSRP